MTSGGVLWNLLPTNSSQQIEVCDGVQSRSLPAPHSKGDIWRYAKVLRIPDPAIELEPFYSSSSSESSSKSSPNVSISCIFMLSTIIVSAACDTAKLKL